jgi:hypothetical protein
MLVDGLVGLGIGIGASILLLGVGLANSRDNVMYGRHGTISVKRTILNLCSFNYLSVLDDVE